MNKIFPLLFLILGSIFLFKCSPAIHSFSVAPRTITNEDSVKVTWNVSGKPTLLIHENIKDSNQYLELTLVTRRRGKEKKQLIQVAVLPEKSSDIIDFASHLHGDTLVASGIKNIQRWGTEFEIETIASACGRFLLVTHSNLSIGLNSDGNSTRDFEGKPIEGFWEFRYLLNDAEKKDKTTLPTDLKVIVTLKHKRR